METGSGNRATKRAGRLARSDCQIMLAGLVQELVDHVPGVIGNHDWRDDEVGDLKDKKNGLHGGVSF